MKIHEIISEGAMQPIKDEAKAAMMNAQTFPALNQSTGSAYMNYRMGIALAGAPTYPTKMEADNWIGGDPLLSTYTEVEQEMINAAAKAVGTIFDHAIMVTSLPGRLISALPNSTICSPSGTRPLVI